MWLFDEIAREYDGPALYAEPAFDYLNHSSRPEAEKVRRVVEGWFERYPEPERADLCGRFRSRNNRQHYAAFFELLLHELLMRLECNVQIHPATGNESTKRPDFLVESPSGERFYTEVVLATAESEKVGAARARANEVYDALNRLDSPNFFIGMNISGAPKTPPPGRQIRASLKRKLDALDPDDVAGLWESDGSQAVPRWHYEHEGWRIEFVPIPKSSRTRGTKGIRPIGTQFYGFRSAHTSNVLRDAILAKASHYGDIDLPFVIATNIIDDSTVDRIDIMDALLGKEQYTIPFGHTGASEPQWSRKPDGVWTSTSGPRYTRVSAVVVAGNVLPWTVGVSDASLVHNPWAKRPYRAELTRLRQFIPTDGRMQRHAGESLASLLGLPNRWPLD